MQNLLGLYQACREELAALGITCGPVSQVVADGRMKRTWGTCRKNPDGSYRDIVHPINSDFRENLERTVIDAYHAQYAIRGTEEYDDADNTVII